MRPLFVPTAAGGQKGVAISARETGGVLRGEAVSARREAAQRSIRCGASLGQRSTKTAPQAHAAATPRVTNSGKSR